MAVTTAISPILYGLVHFLAWNDHFPTPLERLLWRVFSIIVTCSGLVGVLVLWPISWMDQALNSRYRLDVIAAIMFIVVIQTGHVVASGFLLVESFRQLFFLDSAAYQLQSWSIYVPHLA
jgi:hypothetical protein